MSCKYNNCKHCGYKSECEIFKENAETQQEYFGKVRTDNSETLKNALNKIADLKKQIEKMKNCRNCKNEKIEGACGHFTQVGWCKNWELAE